MTSLTLLTGLGAWFLISVVLGALLGRVIGRAEIAAAAGIDAMAPQRAARAA
jgi:hypothetical protein